MESELRGQSLDSAADQLDLADPAGPSFGSGAILVLGWQSGAVRGRGGGRAGRDPDLSLAIAAVRRRVAADRGVARARHRLAFAAGSAQQAVRVAGEVGEAVKKNLR